MALSNEYLWARLPKRTLQSQQAARGWREHMDFETVKAIGEYIVIPICVAAVAITFLILVSKR